MQSVTVDVVATDGQTIAYNNVDMGGNSAVLLEAEYQPTPGNAVLNVKGVTFGPECIVDLTGSSSGNDPVINSSGNTINDGQIYIESGARAILNIQSGSFVNDGLIVMNAAPNASSSLAIDGNGTFYNNGAATFSDAVITTNVLGSGDICFQDAQLGGTGYVTPSADFEGGVGAGQIIDMGSEDGLSRTSLTIGDLRAFKASIEDFLPPSTVGNGQILNDSITVKNAVTSFKYQGNSSSGTLALYDGRTEVGTISFVGNYNNSDFKLTQLSRGETLISHT
jgi:hypothetical protein